MQGAEQRFEAVFVINRDEGGLDFAICGHAQCRSLVFGRKYTENFWIGVQFPRAYCKTLCAKKRFFPAGRLLSRAFPPVWRIKRAMAPHRAPLSNEKSAQKKRPLPLLVKTAGGVPIYIRSRWLKRKASPFDVRDQCVTMRRRATRVPGVVIEST